MARQSSKQVKLKKVVKKSVKKKPIILVLLLLLVGGAVGGFFTAQHLTRNDKFEIVGEQCVYISVGEDYQDEGAHAISFGRDVSAGIKTESNLDVSTPGEYYIKYTVSDIRYNGICRYRYIVVSEVADEE